MALLQEKKIRFLECVLLVVCLSTSACNLHSKEEVTDRAEAKPEKTLKLGARYYTIARVSGPAMKPSGVEGLHTKILEKPIGQIGLVLVHCWNVGEPNGPYPIEPNSHCPGEPTDWVPTAHEIIKNKIKPVLTAARAAGIEVFHMAQWRYADRYPQYLEIKKDPELQTVRVPFERCIRPKSVKEIWDTEYGPNYPGPMWEIYPNEFDIAKAVRPLPNETVFTTTEQINGICRRKGIDTLVYVGFMADICLVGQPGAIEEMSNKYRYRCIVLRDCTTAYEYPETYEGKWMKFAAIRNIETRLGFSATAKDFIAACEKTLSIDY